MIRNLFIGLILGLSSLAFAIEVGTSVASVAHEGSHETVGSITLTLADNDLMQASFETPIYIRVGLNQFRGWSETLVDMRPGSNLAVPINMAVYPKDGVVLNPALPVDAIQLVRLIEGEGYAWFKVTSSSSFWIMVDGLPSSPSEARKVSITMGVRGFLSVRAGAHTPSGGNEFADTHELADTRLQANYFQTPTFSNGDLETIDLIAFDHHTHGVEGSSPSPGNNLGIGFTNDYIVARAVNFYPCFEYHFKAGQFETPAAELPLTLLNLVQRRTYNRSVPEVFFTNSSDFDWEAGSMFYLVHNTYNPDYDATQTEPPAWYDPTLPTTHLMPADIVVMPSSNTTWQLEKLFFEDRFMGYKLTLLSGFLKPYDYVRLEGMALGTTLSRTDEAAEPLSLTAWGYYKAQGVNTTLNPRQLPPITAVTAKLILGAEGPQIVLPYVPWDRPNLDFWAHISNPHEISVHYSVLIYHPFGLLEKVWGARVLAPHSSETIALDQWPEDKNQMGWIAIYADHPLVAVGELRDRAGETLDVYPSTKSLSSTLYAPHVAGDGWHTSAYMVSADPQIDPTFTYQVPGETVERRISGFLIPSGTGNLDDTDFGYGQNRAPWFQVHAGSITAAGILLYSTDDARMLASVPMPSSPQTLWRFEHLGSESNGWFNGVVMVNPSNQPSQVTLTGYTPTGVLVASETYTLNPEERRVGLLPSMLTANEPIARLYVSANQPILSFLLLGRTEGNRMTAIPGGLSASTHLEMPFLPSLSEYWVGLALVNNSNANTEISLRPYRASGEAGPELKFTVESKSKRVFSLGDLIDEGQGYTHLAVTSELPIDAFGLTGSLDNRQLATLPLEGVDSVTWK